MNVNDAPEPSDNEEPGRAHDVVLTRKLRWRDVVLLENVLVVGDVAVPSGRADKQLCGEIADLPGDLLRCYLDFVNDARLRGLSVDERND